MGRATRDAEHGGLSVKAKEMRDKTPEELNHLLAGWRDELFKIDVRAMTGQTEQCGRLKLLRKDIARALTVLVEREHGGAENRKGEVAS